MSEETAGWAGSVRLEFVVRSSPVVRADDRGDFIDAKADSVSEDNVKGGGESIGSKAGRLGLVNRSCW